MHECELMLIRNSLGYNKIGDEGAKSIAVALQSSNCKVTSIRQVEIFLNTGDQSELMLK